MQREPRRGAAAPLNKLSKECQINARGSVKTFFRHRWENPSATLGKPQRRERGEEKQKKEKERKKWGNRKWEEREKRQSAYIFRRININCVINKNERGQGRKEKGKKGREGGKKSISSRLALAKRQAARNIGRSVYVYRIYIYMYVCVHGEREKRGLREF